MGILTAMIPGLAEAKLAAAALAFAAVLGLGWSAKHEYDSAHSLSEQVSADKLQIDEIRVEAARVEAGLTQVAAAATARADAATALRNRIHAAPSTSTCAASPAVAALLDGLRSSNGGPAAAPGSGRAAHLPGTAAAPGTGRH